MAAAPDRNDPAGGRETTVLHVDGMDCASCVAKLEKALTRTPGIGSATVNFAAETATLDAEDEAAVERARSTIDTLGFTSHPIPQSDLPADEDAAPVRLHVDGMDCASCVSKLETALTRSPGVHSVTVNFAAETVDLDVDDRRALDKAQATIRSLGFDSRERLDDAPATSRGHGGGCCGHDHDAHSHSHGDGCGCAGDHGHSHAHPHVHAHAEGHEQSEGKAGTRKRTAPWWLSGKARPVVVTGTLMAAAYLVSLVAPEVTRWAFTVAAAVAVAPFARRAVLLARLGSPFSIEMLMSVAAIGALILGAAEEAAAVIFLFAVGELLENFAAGRARAGIKALVELVPKTAIRVTDEGQETVPADRLAPGDVVLVRPGDRVPGDGTILEGTSDLDESPVTGESVPVLRSPGDEVLAGSVNAAAVLRVRIDRAQGDNTLSRIIRMVEEAQATKAPTARFIDRFAERYTPIAMAVALAVAIVPPLLLGGEWGTWVYRALAILLIACPCALVISTPAAITSGIANGARRGLLVKGGAALETLATVRTLAFDKTGTLTEGRPRVTDVLPLAGDRASLLRLAAAVEQGSSHPLARAICGAFGESPLPEGSDGRALAGRAVEATVEGRRVAVGSPRYAAEQADMPEGLATRLRAFEEDGKTAVVVLADGEILGAIALRDEPRADTAEAIGRLRALGISPVMLTGDNERTGKAVGGLLGIDVRAGLMPADKLSEISRLGRVGPRRHGRRRHQRRAGPGAGPCRDRHGRRHRRGARDGRCGPDEGPGRRHPRPHRPRPGDAVEHPPERRDRARPEERLPRDHDPRRHEPVDGDLRRHRRDRARHPQRDAAPAARPRPRPERWRIRDPGTRRGDEEQDGRMSLPASSHGRTRRPRRGRLPRPGRGTSRQHSERPRHAT